MNICTHSHTHLDVAVDDALLVHVPHCFGALRKVRPHLVLRQQAVRWGFGSSCAQKLFQVSAARPLQDNVQLLALQQSNKGSNSDNLEIRRKAKRRVHSTALSLSLNLSCLCLARALSYEAGHINHRTQLTQKVSYSRLRTHAIAGAPG